MSSRQGVTNPKLRRRFDRIHRLENAEWGVEDQKNPKELRERPRLKNMREIRDYVEMQIQEAISRGDFQNLKNKGKKLSDRDPNSPTWTFDIALRIMKDNNIKPVWIELMNEIDAEKKKIRSEMRLARLKYHEKEGIDNDLAETIWKKHIESSENRIQTINKKVDHFNLIKPERLDIFRRRLKIHEEVDRISAEDDRIRAEIPPMPTEDTGTAASRPVAGNAIGAFQQWLNGKAKGIRNLLRHSKRDCTAATSPRASEVAASGSSEQPGDRDRPGG